MRPMSARRAAWEAILTGFFCGGLIAVADISLHCAGRQSGGFLELARCLLSIVFVYGAVAALACWVVQAVFWRIARRRGIEAPARPAGRFCAAFCAGTTAAVVLHEVLATVPNVPDDLVTGALVISGLSAAWAAVAVRRTLERRPMLLRLTPAVAASALLVLWIVQVDRLWQPLPQGAPLAVPRSSTSEGRPNILWLVLGSARADHVSAFGYKRPTTPALDGLARESTVYLNALASAPDCFSSYASLLSGLSPNAFGASSDAWPWLDSALPHLPAVLAKSGYRTAAISEDSEFAPDTNLDQGFAVFQNMQTFAGAESLIAARALARIQWEQGGEVFLALARPSTARISARLDQTVDQWIRGWSDQSAPFFLMVGYPDLTWYATGDPEEGYFLPNVPLSLAEARWRTEPREDDTLRLRSKYQMLQPLDVEAATAFYDAHLRRVDRRIGKLLSALRERSLLDKTLVIVTSDHGVDLGERNEFGFGSRVALRQLHVPLFVRFPPVFSPGRRRTHPVSLTALYPTVLECAGLGPHSAGRSRLIPLDQERPVISEFCLPYLTGAYGGFAGLFGRLKWLSEEDLVVGSLGSVYAGRYHYICTRRGERLYDVLGDPAENHDLRDSLPERALQLRNLWRAHAAEGTYWGPEYRRWTVQ